MFISKKILSKNVWPDAFNERKIVVFMRPSELHALWQAIDEKIESYDEELCEDVSDIKDLDNDEIEAEAQHRILCAMQDDLKNARDTQVLQQVGIRKYREIIEKMILLEEAENDERKARQFDGLHDNC